MFPVPYVVVSVAINGETPHRYNVRKAESFDFAAERHAHYRAQLGAFTGSTRSAAALVDNFERGSITIGL